MTMAHRRAPRIVAVLIALAVGMLLVPELVGIGPISPPILAPTITVCDRHYRGGDRIRTRAEIDALGDPLVLADPGPFGLLPSCPGPDAQGLRPCTRDALAGACATVVYVRVGSDAYAEFALVGGP